MRGNSISITNSILRFFEKIQPILISVNALSHFPPSGMKWRLILAILIPPVLFLLFWQGFAQFMVTFRQVPFPGPASVIQELFSLVSGNEKLLGYTIFHHVGASLTRWGIGYGIGVGAGILAGLILALSPILELSLFPLVSLVHLVPGLAWIPVAILTVGIGPRTAILLIALTAFPPITVSLRGGMKAVPSEYILVSRMCGDSALRRFVLVQIPAALPHLMSGLRVGLANSWRVVVAAEMVVGSGSGLGYAIIQSRWTLDYVSSFVCIGFIVFFGLITDYGLFRYLERLTIRRWGVENG
jgi:ABC-type nitrate/sulfonate/bicarbonate transport system permease component